MATDKHFVQLRSLLLSFMDGKWTVDFGKMETLLLELDPDVKYGLLSCLFVNSDLGKTAFHCAAMRKDKGRLLLCMASGLTPTQRFNLLKTKSKCRSTVLHLLVSNSGKGAYETVKFLFESMTHVQKNELVNLKDITGFSVLHAAIIVGTSVQVIRLLLDCQSPGKDSQPDTGNSDCTNLN